MNNIAISITNDATLSIIKDGRQYTREANPEELLNVLKTGAVFSTGILPANTRFFAKRGSSIVLILELPPMRRTILLVGNAKVESVPLPGAVYISKLSQDNTGVYRQIDCRLWAIQSAGITSFDQKLFRYPTPNTGTGGNICWGSQGDHAFTMRSLAGVEQLVRAYFASIFNHHMWAEPSALSTAGKTAITGWAETGSYFRGLKDKETFDDSWLFPISFSLMASLNQVASDIITAR